MNFGRVNTNFCLESQGISGLSRIYYNCLEPDLVSFSIIRKEAELGAGGALLVSTGEFTGRSPRDKFIVSSQEIENEIWWENNQEMSKNYFNTLYKDMLSHMKGKEYFVQDLAVGADARLSANIRVVTELAWHSLFIRHLLRRPLLETLHEYIPEYTVINCPSFKAIPERHGCSKNTVIAINFPEKIILIAGTEYAGENKKAIFTLMNFILPKRDILPMHCSANHAKDESKETAIFFGLSGTGKTTLSTDPERILIGDDEHGWSEKGLFNFEGGCYAKTINLSLETEPEIYATTSKFGSVLENVVFDQETKALDFNSDLHTSNTRCAYPLDFVQNVSKSSNGRHPKNIIMLTCDAFGVLPPIAKLTPSQASYHFLSGFTSKVAGTELGVTEPEPTFSACFSAPFLPLRPEIYSRLLKERIISHKATCWLVNTGWTGGPYGTGKRMPIKLTRKLIRLALKGVVADAEFREDPNFGFLVPISVPDVEDKVLDPQRTWPDPDLYNVQARALVSMFAKNFEQYMPFVDEGVRAVSVK